MTTPKEEDYLKTIYALQDDESVTPTEIATELDVTAPTVTSMTKKLHEQGLIEREAYKGVTLTDEGEQVALEVLRHHRLLELFLTETLDYEWTDVHEEADRLEHHISEKLERHVAAALDEPEFDPHGDPIPTVDLELLPEEDIKTLADCEADETVVVRQVEDRDPAELAYLADAGITPGAELTVTEVAPFGMVTVQPTERESPVALPEEITTIIHVEPATDAQLPPDSANGVI